LECGDWSGKISFRGELQHPQWDASIRSKQTLGMDLPFDEDPVISFRVSCSLQLQAQQPIG